MWIPKKWLAVWLAACSSTMLAAQVTEQEAIQPFPLNAVRLLESPFKKAQDKDIEYILALKPDRLLAPYRREAGLPAKDSLYPNWENTGLDGHMGGHYLSALALMSAATGNPAITQRLAYMLNELQRCQEAGGNGYLGGVPGSARLWKDIAAGNIKAGSFSLNDKWVPLYNIHKMFAGLRDAWRYTGSRQARDMLIRFTDWMLAEVASLSDEQVQQMLRSEQGGLNEVFADVYAITGNERYLQLARRFSHKALLLPLENREDKLSGIHANTQIPKVIGFKRIADLGTAEDSAYNTAARFFWETVVHNRSCAIGGNSVREHFNPANDFSSMIQDVQGPETCNTYNMLKLTRQLYLSDTSLAYIDFYERALYNHILSTENTAQGGFVYFTSMRPGAYRVYSQPQTSFWCCVGSGLENHAKYGEMIYARQQDRLLVNLFIPSVLHWKEKGVTLTQRNNFPQAEQTSLTVTTDATVEFNLSVRYPAWVQKGALKIWINNRAFPVTATPGQYIRVQRKWKNGDVVRLQLPMHTTFERLPDSSAYLAILHGPIVLAANAGTADLKGLYADAGRGGHIASGPMPPLQDLPSLVNPAGTLPVVQPVSGKPFTFRLSSTVYPAGWQQTELVPFYTLHDTRYILYWRTFTPQTLQRSIDSIKKAEEQLRLLKARTIDEVAPGEQQPESDHFIESEQSNTGTFRDRHWRDARKWFSYRLRNDSLQARVLRVTYYGKDAGRHFFIRVNDRRVAEVQLDGTKGDRFIEEDYALPFPLPANLTVRFEAADGSVAGGIYGVRLMK